jgi:hypothetical protein
MSTVWKPTGVKATTSPVRIRIVLGKNALASLLSFSKAFWLAGGNPMKTVLVDAIAAPGKTSATPNTARGRVRAMRLDIMLLPSVPPLVLRLWRSVMRDAPEK